jgi:hypothetical protein
MEDDLEAEDFDFNSMVCCVPLIGMAECILKARKIANDRLKKGIKQSKIKLAKVTIG